jgi:hypothetical protein
VCGLIGTCRQTNEQAAAPPDPDSHADQQESPTAGPITMGGCNTNGRVEDRLVRVPASFTRDSHNLGLANKQSESGATHKCWAPPYKTRTNKTREQTNKESRKFIYCIFSP